MRIHRAVPGDESRILAASHLFDNAAQLGPTRRVLAEPTHHLLIAYEDDVAAGFVSGVEMTHPDKGTEMFLYELGVDATFRRQGVGRALVTALADTARDRGCYGMWVLTDDDNPAALATYAAAGGIRETPARLFTWSFDRRSSI